MTSRTGFQKIAFAPRLTGAAVGGLMGAAAAPEEETSTGALMGAGMGYGLGALGDHVHKRLTRPGAPAAPAPAVGGVPHTPEEMAAAHREVEHTLNPTLQGFDQQLGAAKPAAPKVPPAPPDPRVAEGQKVLAKMQQARTQSPSTLRRAHTAGRQFLAAGRPKVGFAKLAEHGLSVSPQGGSLSLSSKDERLPGMNRWVPRATLQKAFEGIDAGYDDQALTEGAVDSGNIAHPAFGAAIGAALAHYGLPASAASRVLGGLAGAGAGSLYNQATAPQRATNMREALKGAHGERTRNGQDTANESVPLVVSSSSGET